ncbi:MAG: hypothetical protein MJ072_05745, partial [Clostridia bacterium]|nr:hypothetical protein [Clostridia bacterium]
MSVKIFKEEFVKIFKQVIITLAMVLGIALICGCLVKILEKGNPGDVKSILYVTFRDVAPSAITVISAICAFTVYERFNKSVNSDEAYLTFTLPATMRQQIKGRYFALLLWLAIIVVVAFLSDYIFDTIISIGETYPDYPTYPHTITVDEVLTSIELILMGLTGFT